MTETVANFAALALIAVAVIGTALAAVMANRTDDEGRRVLLPIPVKAKRSDERRS